MTDLLAPLGMAPAPRQVPFRETLTRTWGSGDRRVCWIMQNPSTADDREDDPTIRRCIGFSKRWGFDGLVVVNTYTRRATDPRDLYLWIAGISHADLAEHQVRAYSIIGREALASEMTIAAWGNGRADDEWPRTIAKRFWSFGLLLHHLGLTMSGCPKHPLARGHHRIPDTQQPARWSAGERYAAIPQEAGCDRGATGLGLAGEQPRHHRLGSRQRHSRPDGCQRRR